MRKQATIPLETPVVPVNRRQVGKQLICRHSRIEKPKRNFDRPSIDHPLLTNERCSTSARCRFLLLLTHRRARSSRTNCLHSQLISEMCSHQEAPFKGQISTPSRAFALRFLSPSLFRQFRFSFFPARFPTSLGVSPSISLTLVIISIPNQFYQASAPHHPCPTASAVIELQGVNRFEYCSRSIRELMGTPLPI